MQHYDDYDDSIFERFPTATPDTLEGIDFIEAYGVGAVRPVHWSDIHVRVCLAEAPTMTDERRERIANLFRCGAKSSTRQAQSTQA